jgi:hypothetical protein
MSETTELGFIMVKITHVKLRCRVYLMQYISVYNATYHPPFFSQHVSVVHGHHQASLIR